MPGARRRTSVVRVLIAPISVEVPVRRIATTQSVCPGPGWPTSVESVG